jgi:propanol-preferring alcohol dehydrogenase
LDGGYAEYAAAYSKYCFLIPDAYPDVQAAFLLCAGLIGYRSLRMAMNAEFGVGLKRHGMSHPNGARYRIGMYGFGASAHITIQIARYEGHDVYAFRRPGDKKG